MAKSDQKQLLSLACQYLAKDNHSDEDDPIAKVWANKLKKLEPQQRLLAEKAINDILFEAELGTLHKHSVKINCPEHFISRPASAQSWTSSSREGRVYATNYVSPPMTSPDVSYQQTLSWQHPGEQSPTEATSTLSVQEFLQTFQ